LATALILKRLGSTQSTKFLLNQIRKNCVHLSFLGRKLYKNFHISKNIKKSGKKQKNFAHDFVTFVLKRLLSCEVVRKSHVAHKIQRALSQKSHARKNKRIVKNSIKLAKAFKGHNLNPKKNLAKIAKKGKKSKKNKKGKKLRKAVKKMKKVEKLKKKLLKAQKKCGKKGFKKESNACKDAKKLRRIYRKKARKIKKVVVKSCRKLKVQCFSLKFKCKQMFQICKKATKIKKSLKSAKAVHFAMLFSDIIKKLN